MTFLIYFISYRAHYVTTYKYTILKTFVLFPVVKYYIVLYVIYFILKELLLVRELIGYINKFLK